MKRIYLLLLLTCATIGSYAQVTGTKVIGVDYTNLAAAISALNTGGISGAVVINVPAGWTETAPSGGYVLGSSTLNASTSSTNTLTIQKSGSGANPLITAPVGTTTTNDGIFIIQGTDYVTITAIDLQESSSNVIDTTMMEWGYALVKRQNSSPFDGCQYVTIQNCNITLNQADIKSVGIYGGNHIATDITALTITSTSDALRNCTFAGNTISNVNRGISLTGFSASSPYTLYDQNNAVGGTSSNQGNTITNFGGTSTAGYGIYLAAQNGAVARFNTITSATTPGSSNIYGIFHGVGNNSSFTASGNTIQLTLGSIGVMYGIANGTGSANSGVNGSTASLTISGNTFQNYSFTASNSSVQYPCVYNMAGTTSGWDMGPVKITGNIVNNLQLNATSTHYLFYHYYCNTNDIRFNDNKITNVRRTGTAGNTYVWYNYYGYPTAGTDSCVRNKIANCSAPYSFYGLYNYLGVTTRNRVVQYDTVMNDSCALNSTYYYLYGIYSYYGNNQTVTNNYIANNYCNPTNYGGMYAFYVGYGNTQVVSNNTIRDCNLGYYLYGYYTYGSSVSAQVNNNLIDNMQWPTGTTSYAYLYYPYTTGTMNHYNNTAKNINSSVTTYIYGIYNVGGTTMNFYNDSLYNFSNNSTSTYHVYGYYQSGGTTTNFYDNYIHKLSANGTSGYAYGMQFASATSINVYRNIIDSIAATNSSNTSGQAYGIYQTSGSLCNYYRNKISYVMANGTSSTAWGLYAGAGAQTIHNNLIGNIQLPNSTSTTGTNLVGLYLGTSTTTGYNVSFNTVVLNATSSGSSFSSSAVYWSAASSGYPMTMKNNIFINTSQQSGTSMVSAMRWNTSSTSYYNNYGSNNNLLYAGTPGTYRHILYAGSGYQTLANFKAYVSPADGYSVTENTTFQSLTGVASTFLRPSTTVPTQIESNGVNVTGLSTDHYATIRAGNSGYTGSGVAPDLGAIEDNYTPNDINAPIISGSPLPFSCGTGDRTFTATITDVTGVPTSGTLVPRVYFKKGAAGTWYSNAGTLSSGTATSGTWSFTITSSTMGGLALGDVVYYFVIAQDGVGTPNIGSAPAGAVASNVNTISSYPTGLSYSVAGSLSGTITVGSGGTYSTLTAAAAAYNTSCISGPIVFSLISSTYPSETFPITFNANAYASSTNTLTIKPASGVVASISGSATSSAIIKFNGADYITIDGSNTSGGTTRDLTLTNTYTSTSAVVWNGAMGAANNGADYNTVKNVNLVGGTNTSSCYVVYSGATTGIGTQGDDNKNFTVQNCKISKGYYGIYLNGSPAFPHTNTLITQDSIGGTGSTDNIYYYSLYLMNQTNAVVSQNTIHSMKSINPSANIAAIEVGQNVTGLQIVRNTIKGIWNENTGGWGAYGIDMPQSGINNVLIANNMISDLHTINYTSTTPYYAPFGIRMFTPAPMNVKIYHNTIVIDGNVTVGSSAMMSACILYYTTVPGLEIVNNILHNKQTNSVSGASNYSIYQYLTSLPYGVIDYNDYSGVSTSTNTFKVGTNGTGITFNTLPAWATYTGQDTHSIDTLPVFVSTTDNHLQSVVANGPFTFGTPIASVTTDFDGTARSATSPRIGAHEVQIPPTLTTDPTSLTFGPQTTSTYSAAQSFTVAGSFLTTGGTLTASVTPTANFQLSLTGTSGWGSSVSWTYSGSSSGQVVYVRFYPTAVGGFSGTVAITGGGLAAATNVTLNGTGANPCTGTPTPGTAAIAPGIGGPSTPFSLSLTGTTVTGGLLYQWQSSSTGGAGTFTNIAGATTSTYNFTGISGNTWYQAVVTCPTYASATSNTVAATFSMAATYTGTIGTYVVPAGVYAIRIIANGAQGGGMYQSYPLSGGQGAIMQGDFCVTPGQVLKYLVGQMPPLVQYTGGGGGGSFVWDSATNTPLIVAGGGGGSAYFFGTGGQGQNASTGINGTNANGLTGGYGVGGYGATAATSAPSTYYGSGGAGWFSNGVSTNYTGCTPSSTGGSTALSGGAGGAFSYNISMCSPGGFGGGGGGQGYCSYLGAGGGGGYSGGAPGCYASSGYAYGGGGGGSYNSGINQMNSVGNTGNGLIVFTTPATASGSALPTSLTFGVTTIGSASPAQTYTLSASGLVSGGTLTLTPTAGFELSLNATTWCTSSSPCTYTYTGACLNALTVYVRSTPSAVGAYTGTATVTGGNLGSPVVVTLNGTGANLCSGTPTAGTATVTPTSGNTTTAFALTLGGTTVAGGLTYQWQSASSSTGPWTAIAGATNPSYSFTGISATTFFRCRVTCTATGGSTDSTAPVQAIYFPNSGCTPTFLYASNSCSSYNMYSRISALSGYGGTSLSDVTTCNGTGWEDFTATPSMSTLQLQEGTTYSATVQTGSSYNNSCQIWIDFNNDGTFVSSETVGGITSYITSGTASVVIPFGVTPGIFRMRIVGNYHPGSVVTYEGIYPLILPCPNTTIYYGDVRDYKITIVPLPACSGTPTAGTVNSSVPSGCAPLTSSLTVSGATTGVSALTYQWQGSADGSTGWTDVAGATNMAFTPTVSSTIYYRRAITCTTSSSTAYTAASMMTVSLTPTAIVGPNNVCQGSTITLTDSVAGGTWLSSSSGTASVGASTGIVTGVSGGAATITYKLTSTGCQVTQVVGVNTIVPTVSVNATPSTICAGESFTMTATPTSTLPGYAMSTVPYSFITPVSPTTASFTSIDDGYSTVTLPFTFTFFGTNYTTAYIGTNGYITFGSSTTSLSTFSLPTASMPACISYAMGDLYVGGSPGTVTYATNGTAPNRIFVVTFDQIGNCCSAADIYDAQIRLYETSNTVEVMVSKSSGFRTIGIQNAGGTIGYSPAGRNAATYTITTSTPEGYRWVVPQANYAWSPAGSLSATTGLVVTASDITTTPTVTYSVSRTFNGCGTTAVATVTVNPLPNPITGTPVVCEGLTTSLSTSSAGGTWQSSTGSVATVGGTTGVVTGVTAGTTNVSYTYTATGCRTTQVVSVNPVPAPITGTASACVGSSTSLATTTAGGTWSSGTPSVATITSSGVSTGVLAGVANITYMLPTGCIAQKQVTVNPLPSITVTPATTPTICEGESAPFTATSAPLEFSLLNQDFEAGLGLWTINTTISPDSVSKWSLVNASTSGLVSIGFMGIGDGDGTQWVEAAPSAGSGTSNMQSYVTSPSFSTVGFGSATLTFNEYLISLSSADMNVDVQYSINNGATWTTILDQMDEAVTPDPWSLASPDVTLSLPSGALNEPNVKLRWHYYTNYGVGWAIDNISVKAALPAATFTWAGVSGATGLSCTSCASPTVTPTAAGANVYNVTANSTCSSNTNVTINVNPLPGMIGGAGATLCVGNSINLTNPNSGGTWSSSNTTVASVDPATGMVTGNTAGTATISYMLPSTCARTVIVTVNAAPSSITGTLAVCEGGATTTLGHAISGGTWYSSDAMLATIDATSGVATGVNAGTAMITYELPSGCKTWSPLAVNPTPDAFTGSAVVCEASTSTLASASAGGTWSSLGTSYATVDATSGVVTGVAAGNASIIYTLPTGCQRAVLATVNVSPAALTGSTTVCEGMTTALSSATAGGAWSSSAPTTASVTTSGVVSGDAAGNADITYTMGNGCYRTANVLVNPKPDPFTGTPVVCEGATTTLSSTPGGTWSGTTTNASVDATTGVVTGLVQGISPVTYTLSTGCARTADVSVNQSPAAITGSWAVCELATTLLSNSTPFGTWSSDASSTASVDAAGNVTGGAAGNTNIHYTLSNGCKATALMTVNALPDAITGTPSVCEGQTTALGSTTSGGTWSSGTPAIASVGAATGIVSGNFAGTATVAYTIANGCYRSVDVVVNQLPAPISGIMQVCEGLVTNLTDATPGGTWSIDATPVATITAGGSVNGNNAGTTTVTYTLSTGCRATGAVVVNPLPANISGMPVVCEGQTTLFTNSTPGGSWSSGASAIAGVNSTGLVNGVSAGITSITYSLSTGCLKELPVIVNVTPAVISGSSSVCEGAVSMQSTTPTGGVWTSSAPGVGSVDASGTVTGVTAGAIVITYAMPSTTCMRTKVMAVNPLPAPITGATTVCQGAVTMLSDATSGGTWSALSSGVTVDATTGAVTGVTTGVAPVAYILPTGCSATANINVDATPDPITGTLDVCEGATTGLSSTTMGGTWTSGATVNATITSGGVVSGIVSGIVPISYSVSTGCAAVAMVTVNALPDVIGGVPSVCEGATTALTNTVSGGMWSSTNVAAGTVDATTGVVTGVAAGTTNVIYTLGTTGCSTAASVVVNPAPAMITGPTSVCAGSTAALSDATTGGTWSTSSANATVDMATGVVSGVTAGTADVTYTVATGCSSIAPMIVNPLPADIDGLPQVCQGSTTALADITPLGTWSSDNAAVATVDAMGVVTGVVTGASTASSANIIYTLSTGCAKAVNVMVDPLPAAIGGSTTVCEGSTTGLTCSTIGGAWSSSSYGTAYVDMVTGALTGVTSGAATVTYTLTSGCLVTAPVVVNPLPSVITGTPTVCEGATTVLSSTTSGGTWSSGAPGTATVTGGVVSGVAAGTVAITYAISTGCARVMDVMVNDAPTVYAVTGGGAYCAGTTGAVVGVSNSDASALYQLYSGTTALGSAVPGVSGPLSFGPQAVGTYSVLATDPTTGCTSGMTGIVSTVITSTVTPSVSLSTGSSSTTVCAGTMTMFTATPVNGGSVPSYDWTVNGISVASGVSPTFSYIPVNGDVVNVTLNSSATCAAPLTAGSSVIMTVNPLEMPVATISLPIGVSTICDGSPVTITATSVFGGATPMYTWFKGGIPTGVIGSSYTFVPVSGETVYATMLSSFGCVVTPTVNSNTLTMITAPVFVPVVSIAVSPGTSVPAGTPVTFTAVTSSTGPTPSYQWYVNGGLIPGATGVNFTTSTLSGSDSVSCKVTGSEPCGYESFNSVIMRIKPVGVAQVAGVSDIILVPNPNKGDFIVKGSLASKSNEEVTIEVTNVLGQTVYTGKMTAKNGTVNERIQLNKSLANGMYMLNLHTESETQVFHFVLEQ